MPDPIEDLRLNIRKLAPDGEAGFEGLIAAVLCDLTKRSFALASAGSQRGKDGQSALDGGAILFEAKRYDDGVPKDVIYTKILELAAYNRSTAELFVLAATTRISAQHIDTLKDAARQLSLAVLVLAWPEAGLPELATLLSMTAEVSAKFIAKHASVDESELAAQLEAVRGHPQFEARSEELMAILSQPNIAPAFALKDNQEWLMSAFSDHRRAKIVFGQTLSPSDTTIPCTIDRPALRDRVASLVFAKADGAVVAILGMDGNGKSWIFAQAWTRQADRPLTVVTVPEEIVGPPSPEYCQELLISKLLTQTGDTQRAEAKERWLRHFERWRNMPDAPAPRIVVFLDGLNQRVTIEWRRFITVMGDVVAKLGGRLVFSCRRQFYKDNLEGQLGGGLVSVEVPEWTDSELDALLKERGTSLASLNPEVVRSLRNPRIFGIAATLFKAEQIAAFGELSVSRLLFEHILSGSAVEGTIISRKQFAANICTHAESVVERMRQRQDEGLTEFDLPTIVATGQQRQSLTEQFVITSAGRFFEVLDDNPNKYILKEEGLPLALGLALVQAVKAAIRHKKSVDEALAKLLDPIAALDRTCDILLGAILSAVLEDAPDAVVTPLVRSFVMLQNLDSTRFPEFCNLFARTPTPFLAALEEAALTRDVVSNVSWLTDALRNLRGRESFEAALAASINRWLKMYSLALERRGLGSTNPEHSAQREERRAIIEKSINRAVASLSTAERELLATMVPEEHGNYGELSLLAFRILAGRPLEPFAESLRTWCFATALNIGGRDHLEVFNHLVQFNLTDWPATRSALLRSSALLREPGTSRTGQWALVHLLRATGDSDDAKEAASLTDELTKDQEKFGNWRRIHSFCATDPCDPASDKPDNIDATATAHVAIDPSKLRQAKPTSADSHNFQMAQPGLARFRPAAAIKGLRALADQALSRELPDFRMAVFFLEDQTVGLEARIAGPYIRKATEVALAAGEDKNGESWVAAQYALSIAFPHMSGDEQFEALLSHPKDKSVMLDLCLLFQPIQASKLEAAFSNAVSVNDPVPQFRILCFAQFSRTPLTDAMRQLVLGCLKSQDDHVRLSALSLIQFTSDPFLLGELARSEWSAAKLDAIAHKIEILHGSRALVQAAELGALSVEACLERIGMVAYAELANRLGQAAVHGVAARLNTAIAKAAEFQVPGILPDIEQHFEGRYWPTELHVSVELPKTATPQEVAQSHSETGDAWYARYRRNQDASDSFERDLSKAGAQLIVQSVTVALIQAIDKFEPSLVDSWYSMLMALDASALDNLYNMALVVAETVSKRDAMGSIRLFEKLKGRSPRVRVVFGSDNVTLDAATAWGIAADSTMRQFCYARLDCAGNDHELAMEVLAAVRAGREDVLRDYVIDRRQRVEPAHRARAAMLAGLSPESGWALETIELLRNEHGFMQSAYQAATYAMQRHQWSRHWAAQMRQATDPVDLWRYSILLAKIVDGRFKGIEVTGGSPSTLVRRFGSTLNGPIRNRIKAWKGKRESKLFGMNAPGRAFLPGGDSANS